MSDRHLRLDLQFLPSERGIQVARLLSDPVSGRRQLLILGSLDPRTLTPSPDLKTNANPDERAQIERWIAHQRRLGGLQGELAALCLPDRIQRVARWLERQALDEHTRLLIADLRAAWLPLRATLRRRGLI